ncbi:haloacid dehalogenase type II [Pikeienuella sp. HZG-20]|uniref:haloacid dehalogenase type II n=1 Tax=Paludibacillus litoralis TaxID=3133267 RepID=UPI0030EF454E
MNAKTPSVIVFDVNETLLDITTLEPLFDRVFNDGSVMREWFAQLVLYSQTMTLSGLYTPFGALAVGALRMIGRTKNTPVTDQDIDELKERMGALPAHPDVVPALTRLRDAGLRLATFTNSAPGPGPSPLERAGIGGFFERSLSVDAVRKFKPAPETYAHVATEMDVQPSDLCLVACHVWDTIGAQSAGWLGALVTRPHNAPFPAEQAPQPDFVSPDLVDLSEQMLRRWSIA